MSTNSDFSRYQELQKQLKAASDSYYKDGVSPMSDQDFDFGIKELEALETAHPEWKNSDSLTAIVGSDLTNDFKKVEHRIPMLSISNAYSQEEVADFICKNGKHGDVKYVQHYLSPQDYAKTLAECWVRDEQPNINPNFTKTELTSMFRRADKKFLMSEAGYKKWQELPEKVTAYRGVTEYNGKNVRVLSWTTNYETAKWFAGRFEEQGKIYQAEIDKKHIFAYIDQRGESELIIDPKYLENVEMVEDLSMNMRMRL